jgi:ParB family transcriptional regulator, chromosome partitioning protein
MKRPGGLGRGLGALIPQKRDGNQIGGAIVPRTPVATRPPTEDPEETKDVQRAERIKEELREAEATAAAMGPYRELPIEKIVSNPLQPRRHFDHAALEDLVESIKSRGIIEPLIVTERGNGMYELIAGERRFRAGKIAGLEKVPAIIRSATEQDKLEIAIIENVQRHDLNPIEEAIAYKRLMDEFSLTQDEVGVKVGKSRPQVGNTVRLLQLPEEIQQALIERKISASNARTLVSLPTDTERMDLFRAMLAGNFTVRETERRVYTPRGPRQSTADPNVLDVERRLRESLGHRAEIKRSSGGGGEIRIRFENDEDLEGLVGRMSSKS